MKQIVSRYSRKKGQGDHFEGWHWQGVFYMQKLNMSRRAQRECRGGNMAGVACVPGELKLLWFWFLLILVLSSELCLIPTVSSRCRRWGPEGVCWLGASSNYEGRWDCLPPLTQEQDGVGSAHPVCCWEFALALFWLKLLTTELKHKQ